MQALARAAEEIRSGRNPLDDGGIVGLIASDEQRGALARVQSLMSLLEGHGNSVMNKLGREHVAGQARMARVLQARRQSAGFTAFVHKFVGLESKMRQYEVGEAFVAAVEREAGPHAIDAAWRGPEWLPTLDELRAPREWLAARRRGCVGPAPSWPRISSPALAERADFSGLTAPVVVGCSGGADSLALLVLARAAGLGPVAVHVDHGLRADSAADARRRA